MKYNKLQEAKKYISLLLKEQEDKITSPAKLGQKVIMLGRDLKQGEIKGLDVGEVEIIANLIDDIIAGASDGSAKNILIQVEKILQQRLGMDDQPDANVDVEEV